MRKYLIGIGLMLFFTTFVQASNDKKLDHFWDRNTQENHQELLDTNIWQDFIDAYVIEKQQQTYVNYKKVSTKDAKALSRWIKNQQKLDPRQLSKQGYQAYWINLYNAATVNLILQNYPIESITKLGGWFEFGPWDQIVATINGRELSLNDIEHAIMRARFNDARFHYAFNCASVSCPNLSKIAFTAENLEAQLEQGAVHYINHQRGVKTQGNTLILSKIYDWYADDFGDERALLEHLNQYAQPDLKKKLTREFKRINYVYNWQLNEEK
jgi:hypothetical protein